MENKTKKNELQKKYLVSTQTKKYIVSQTSNTKLSWKTQTFQKPFLLVRRVSDVPARVHTY